jgi:acyl phosphate:glycerol-3-phosphate acyltransferase
VARTEGRQPWRRVFHAVAGLLIVAALAILNPSWIEAVAVLGGLTAIALALDVLRLRSRRVNRLFFRGLQPFASPREAAGIASSTWFVIGCLLTVALFPRDIAVAAILVLALADSTASYVGRRWGRRPLGTGTVEGSLVFLTIALAVLVPLVGLVAALAAALAATVAERLPWPLDDNLTVPLVTGAVLWTLLPWGG